MSFYKLYVGEISPERKADWFRPDTNPDGFCADDEIVRVFCSGGDWRIADSVLRDRVDVDWGSMAWHGRKEEITAFFQACKLNDAPLAALENEKEYAVVFIECAPSDSYL